MSITVTGGMTLWGIAQRYLGDGRRWHELRGYSGDPHRMPTGTVIYLPNESAGPPAQGAQVGGGTPPDPWAGWDPAQKAFVLNDLNQLAADYNRTIGYQLSGKLSQQQLADMAKQGISTAYDFAQYAFKLLPAQDQQNMPWAQFGVTHDQFDTYSRSYVDMIQQMTGQPPTPAQITAALNSTRGQSDPAHWHESFVNDAGNQKAFGWIKYGLNYEDFHTWAGEQSSKFGKQLTQADAVTWLDEEQKKMKEPPPSGSKEIQAQPVAAPSQKSSGSQIGQSAVR